MVIDPESIKLDLRGLHYLIRQLNSSRGLEPTFEVNCDRKGYAPADENRVLTVMKIPRNTPTLIYLAGHTERLGVATHGQSSDDLAYAPADYLQGPSSRPKLIPYETIRQILLKDPSSAPLLLITEVRVELGSLKCKLSSSTEGL